MSAIRALPLQIRILTAAVMTPTAIAYGFLIAWFTKTPDWGVVIAWVTVCAGALYGMWLASYLLQRRGTADKT